VRGFSHQTLLGVTGSGKTFTMANVIARWASRPCMTNKTLAAQLYAEFKEFFPNNAVEYFVSYYDYYQRRPMSSKTCTSKRTRHQRGDRQAAARATKAILKRRDVIIVASVSCIYGLGTGEYRSFVLP